jgi:hypothetical protein
MTEPATVQALVIQPDGNYEYRSLPTGYPDFNQSFLGKGHLEALYPRSDLVFWFDEEGKYKNLPPNPLATNLYFAIGGAPFLGAPLEGVVAVTSRNGPEMADCPNLDEYL